MQVATRKAGSAATTPVLRLVVGDDEIFSVSARELPVEKLPVVALFADRPLRFIDSGGDVRDFDLSSAVAEGARFLHMSVRVSAAFTVQPDGILTHDQEED